MLKNVLEELKMSQETVAEMVGVHRSTIKRCIVSPEAMHPDVILQVADSLKPHTDKILRHYCSECCVIGKRHSHRFRERSRSEAACSLYAAIETLQRRLNNLITIAADNKVDGHEWQEFQSILVEAQDTEQAIIDLEIWMSGQKEAASVGALTAYR